MKIRHLPKRIVIAALAIGLTMNTARASHQTDAEPAIAADTAGSPDAATMIGKAESLISAQQSSQAVDMTNEAANQDRIRIALQEASDAGGIDVAADRDAAHAIHQAEQARKLAASVGGEWRDVGQMIEDAQRLAKSGRFQDAIDLANQAKRQAELGHGQAIRERHADFPAYVRPHP